MTAEPTEKSAQDARQGETGQGVRYVLGIGLLLAVIAMIAVMTLIR